MIFDLSKYTGSLLYVDSKGLNTVKSVIKNINLGLVDTNLQISAKNSDEAEIKVVVYLDSAITDLTIDLWNDKPFKLFLLHFNNTKIDLDVNLNKTNSKIEIYSLADVSKQTSVFSKVRINHNADQTKSISVFKNILKDESEIDLTVDINIDKEIHNIEADLQINSLLLSSNSKVRSRPNLNIFSDGVVCRHANTVSGVESDYVDYLKTRGLNSKESLKLLESAFITQITKEIDIFALCEDFHLPQNI